MTRVISILLIALCLCTGAYAQVVNGDFQTGDFTGWSVDVDTAPGSYCGNWQVQSVTKNFGAPAGDLCAVRSNDTGTRQDVLVLSQTFTGLDPAKMYTVSFWCKRGGAWTSGSSSPTYVNDVLQWNARGGSSGVADWYFDSDNKPPYNWLKYEAGFYPDALGTITWRTHSSLAMGADQLIFDDFKVEPYQDNLGFEKADMSLWNMAGSTLVINTDQAHSGTYSAVRTGSTSLCDLTRTSAFDVLPNHTYVVSYWYKKVGSVGYATIDAYLNLDAGGWVHQSGLFMSQSAATSVWVNNGWVQKVTTIDTNTATKLNILARCETVGVPATDKLYIDDFAIVDVGVQGDTTANLNFEAGNLAFWNAAGGSLNVQSADKNSGNYSAQRTGTMELTWLDRANPMTVKPDTQYEVAYWYKFDSVAPGTRGLIDTGLSIPGTPENYIHFSPLFVQDLQTQTTRASSWARKSGMINTGSNTTIGTNFGIQVPDNANDKIYLDDVSLTEIGPSYSSTVTTIPSLNMNFELGNWTGWEVQSGTASVTLDGAANANTGNFCAKIMTVPGALGDITLARGIGVLDAAKTYKVQYFAKRSSDFVGSYQPSVENPGTHLYTGFSGALGETYSPFTAQFTPIAATYISIRNGFYGMTAGSVWLDDLSIQELVYTSFTSAGAARLAPEGTNVVLKGVVTRAISASQFFVQYVDTTTNKMDKSSAILVDCGTGYALPAAPTPGSVYTFKGNVVTSVSTAFPGMKILSLAAVPEEVTPTPTLTNFTPVATTSKSALATTGTNLDAMFVKLVGKITQVGSDFYLADLSAAATGTVKLVPTRDWVTEPTVGNWYSIVGNLVTATNGTTITKSIMCYPSDNLDADDTKWIK